MPTDDERREAARRLREIKPCKSGHIKWWEIARALGLKQPAGWFGWEKFEPDSANRLADLIEPHRGSGERSILCAHCENASWCGCEPGDEDGGCDFEPSVTEGEPPYNLYTLYEAVFHRSPRCWECIEDDEVDELVDALLDICNVPGHDLIKACDASQSRRDTVSSDPTERGIDSIYNWCFAAIEGADGAEDELYCSIMRAIEDYRHPERATAHTVRTGDRDALLALAVNLDARATELLKVNDLDQSRQRRSARLAHATDLMAACSRIREALGVGK